MGMLNYFSKFVDKLAVTMKSMSDLLKSGAVFQWDSPRQEALQAVQVQMSKATVLTVYRSDKPVVVSADASSCGMGVLLLQAGMARTTGYVLYRTVPDR